MNDEIVKELKQLNELVKTLTNEVYEIKIKLDRIEKETKTK